MTDARRLRVLLIDDHQLLADTVSSALESIGDFAVTSVRCLEEALALIGQGEPYDVVLLDYELPDGRGLEGLSAVIAANGRGVALFSGVAGRAIALEAVAVGASGFIPKTLPLKVLNHALKFIADGGTFLPSDLMRPANGIGDGQVAIKPREEKVLALVSEGLQNKEIARAAGLSETTVKNDVKSLCRKLGARNRTDLVLSARRAGLV
ncbi:response regulator transcription factor [Histidinibacterium lentulum]|nr:response regulator transcription factor [Histidinibacterium lentulum]